MSAAAALLDQLERLGVAARADGDVLRLRPVSLLPADILADLRTHKAEVLALLTAPANDRPPSPVPTDAAGLLAHVRDVLHCRVMLDGDRVMIAPTWCCSPPIVAAALAMVGELRAILDAKAPTAPARPTTADRRPACEGGPWLIS